MIFVANLLPFITSAKSATIQALDSDSRVPSAADSISMKNAAPILLALVSVPNLSWLALTSSFPNLLPEFYHALPASCL
ncbi:hypothetical protein PVK06_036661 [Gossypium arboreum]|uniref:Uncharacterized protein n=1 Tax=Gossypium arboreum TaxID=29729 RepID=A0ABR0NK67_GOSAR|nr:hypothetical protein PVK06_036661 [Gossypium arboreum]